MVTRAFLCVAFLFAGAALPQESARNLSAEFPEWDKNCKITLRDFGGKADWLAHCRLKVFKRVSGGETESLDLFDLDLVQAHPAALREAQAAVETWVTKSSVELLRRNGYKVDAEKKRKRSQ